MKDVPSVLELVRGSVKTGIYFGLLIMALIILSASTGDSQGITFLRFLKITTVVFSFTITAVGAVGFLLAGLVAIVTKALESNVAGHLRELFEEDMFKNVVAFVIFLLSCLITATTLATRMGG